MTRQSTKPKTHQARPRRRKRQEIQSRLELHHSPAATAKFLGIGRTAVYELIKLGIRTEGREGLYPTYNTYGDARRIPESAIIKHLERCKLAALPGGRR